MNYLIKNMLIHLMRQTHINKHLVVELLQQAVQPGFCHLHGPRLVGYVAHFDENHHQLRTGTRCNSSKTTCRSFRTFRKDGSYFRHATQNGFCTRLTTSLCSLLVKSKDGRMDLNLLRISLCLVMSVARMHLQDEQSEALFLDHI